MLFNSISFLIFFPAIFMLYWLLRYSIKGSAGVKCSNILLLVGSYYFYMCWSVEYVVLLFASTLITYGSALGIARSRTRVGRRAFLVASGVLNVAILFFFKYFGFAAGFVVQVMDWLGIRMTVPDFGILLPVGLSFYIFQALGYTIDVYKGTTPVEKNVFTYALFVSFFPQLVAGPIERSSNLLPQFRKPAPFSYDVAVSGLKLMLWGYFMKLVLADRCAEYADQIFNNPGFYNGGSYLLGGIVFAFQIYGDFAGYSLIAIGVARMMGFNLMKNFQQPYYAYSISNFWHRWHISLSTWFKDYIYIPLGGNRKGTARCYRNLMVTFLLSGLWHGANWTFVLWGFCHGLLMCLERAVGWHKRRFAGFSRLWHSVLTYVLVMVLFMVFRADSVGIWLDMLKGIFTNPGMPFLPYDLVFYIVFAVVLVMARDAIVEFGLPVRISDSRYRMVRFGYIVAMIAMIIGLGSLNGSKFIYFQF